jgi:formiminoglutamase
MSALKTYNRKYLDALINKRAGEQKFGEAVTVFTDWEELKTNAASYVLFGIPEAIGVRANLGKPGTQHAWKAGLTALCNIQNNEFTHAENVVILGEIDCDIQNEQAASIEKNDEHASKKLGELVSQIDLKVAEVVGKIVATGKIPIVIGGGHNNSFGTIKGCSQALGNPINSVNFDAHTDFRALEHRHSGNGFSYAFEENYLDRYFIFGMHRNYTSQGILNRIKKYENRVKFNLFETISVNRTLGFSEAIRDAQDFCCENDFGLELDMDAIELMGSSAMTPSGFTVSEARHFINHFSKLKDCRYIHICEGNPAFGTFPNQIGKTIAYLVSDVISI